MIFSLFFIIFFISLGFLDIPRIMNWVMIFLHLAAITAVVSGDLKDFIFCAIPSDRFLLVCPLVFRLSLFLLIYHLIFLFGPLCFCVYFSFLISLSFSFSRFSFGKKSCRRNLWK